MNAKVNEAKNRIENMGFTQDQIDFIFSDWNETDHIDWLLTASKSEIESWGEAADWGKDESNF